MVRTVLQTTLTRIGNMPSGRLSLPTSSQPPSQGGGAKNVVFIGIGFLVSETVRTIGDPDFVSSAVLNLPGP